MKYDIGFHNGYQLQGNGQNMIYDSIEQNGEHEESKEKSEKSREEIAEFFARKRRYAK